jgi:hypothetical protein
VEPEGRGNAAARGLFSAGCIGRVISRAEASLNIHALTLNIHALTFIADFGDVAVIGPAALAAWAMLAILGRRRDAAIWAAAFAACALATMVLKGTLGRFQIIVLHHTIHAASFPSGHAAVSFVFYDGLAALLWYGARSALLRGLAVALVALQIMIVLAVFLLVWHPLIDIVGGLLLGGACLAAAYRIGAPQPAETRPMAGLALVVAALVAALHGEHLDDKRLAARLLHPMPLESSLSASPRDECTAGCSRSPGA